MKTQYGFSLIELMITIVILGILASFAFAGYQEQVRDARRGDCAGALVGLSQAMERFYSANNSYRGAANGGADTGTPAIFAGSCPTDGGTAFYNVTIADADASSYVLQAAPIGGMAEDRCGTLTLTSTGVKGVADAQDGVTWEDCW